MVLDILRALRNIYLIEPSPDYKEYFLNGVYLLWLLINLNRKTVFRALYSTPVTKVSLK